MKTWYGQKWGFRALLQGLIKWWRMLLSETIYLKAEAERMWIETNPGAVSVDANNIQSTPLVIRLWMGEGSTKISVQAYLTLKVESVVGTNTTTLYTYNSPTKVSEFSYTIPADKYATANRISVYAYEDSARTKEIDAKLVNVIADNPIPFPRPEAWAAGLTYKNGEILMLDGQVYMWMSRIAGNTAVNPKTDVSGANPSGKWKAYQHWPLLSTSILMAQFALLGKAVFKDEYMFSQFGVDANGGHTENYRDFGTPAFTPNLMLNFLNGAGHYAKGNIYWDEYGRLYRRSREIIVWRRLCDEIGEATTYQLNLHKGTFIDTRYSNATVYLPDPNDHPDLVIDVLSTFPRTRVPIPFCRLTCSHSPILVWDKDTQKYVEAVIGDPTSIYNDASISSKMYNGVYRWFADSNFLKIN